MKWNQQINIDGKLVKVIQRQNSLGETRKITVFTPNLETKTITHIFTEKGWCKLK